MFLVSAKSPSARKRQIEILEVVARHGWHYFRSKIVQGAAPVEPALPLPDVLCQILLDLGPTFIKLGQLLSTRPDLLGPSYIKALESLQSSVPALSWDVAEPLLNDALGQPWQSQYSEIEPVSIAAGSLAQVHRGRLNDGEMVAIKLQRPHIQRIVQQDLEILAAFATRFSQEKLGQAYDLPALVEEFKISLLGELDFRREGRNTDQIREKMRRSKLWRPGQIIVPQVYWAQTAETVLTLEWIDGVKLTQSDISTDRKHEVATLVARVLLKQIFLDRFFHADPHPGNFLYIGNEETVRIALLDCGMVTLLDPRTQAILTDLLVGIVFEQPRRVAQAVRELGFSRLKVDLRAVETSFDRLLRRFYTRPLEEINLAELLNEALRIPRENSIQMPGSIGLFVKAVANVEGIARQLDPKFPFIEVARPIVREAINQRIMGPQAINDSTQSIIYFSRLLTQFPDRLEILLDRFERSELGLNVLWSGQPDFQTQWKKIQSRQTLALLAMGLLISGALLSTSRLPNLIDTSRMSLELLWSQGLLIAGAGLGLTVIIMILLDR